MTKRFKRQNNVVNQQIPIRFADFVSPRDIVKYWVAGPRRARLIKYVQGFD